VRVAIGQHPGDRAGSRADVHPDAVRGQQLGGPRDQRLGVPPRHEHPGVDQDLDAAELDAARDPGERLPGQPAAHHGIQRRVVAACRSDQLVGLLARGQEAALGQHSSKLTAVHRCIEHLRNPIGAGCRKQSEAFTPDRERAMSSRAWVVGWVVATVVSLALIAGAAAVAAQAVSTVTGAPA